MKDYPDPLVSRIKGLEKELRQKDEELENTKILYDERIELYKKYCDVEIINDGTIEKTVKSIIEALSI